jgi:hypothetical protein
MTFIMCCFTMCSSVLNPSGMKLKVKKLTAQPHPCPRRKHRGGRLQKPIQVGFSPRGWESNPQPLSIYDGFGVAAELNIRVVCSLGASGDSVSWGSGLYSPGGWRAAQESLIIGKGGWKAHGPKRASVCQQYTT